MATTIDFPTFSKLPSQNGYEEIPIDNAISDESEAGYMFSRPMSTRMIWQYRLAYDMLPDADVQKLRDFLRLTTQGSGISFNWTNPVTGEIREMKFVSKQMPSIKYVTFGTSNETVSLGNLWNVDFTLQEV